MANFTKRIASDGTISYRVLVRLKGHPAQSATFARLTDAKRWAASTESAIREGRHFLTSQDKSKTLNDLIKPIIGSASQRTIKERGHILEFWSAKLGAYSLGQITPAKIGDLRDELLQSGSGFTNKGLV